MKVHWLAKLVVAVHVGGTIGMLWPYLQGWL